MTSKRNIDDRLNDLESTDEEDDGAAVYIYDTTDADEPACVIGGEDE